MHIILDANIYAADYRLAGVSFKTLFDYMRRTTSTLVLPRIIREEVVYGYGRRLKKESKDFAEAHRKYKSVDIKNRVPTFDKPDIGKATRDLRRKLMKPSENVTVLYSADTSSVSVDDVFIRGIRRIRPANESGEELRDVIIWLWALGYSASASERVAFVSSDSGFWSNDAPHPDIVREIDNLKGRLSIYKTIEELLKKHAPVPTQISVEWFSQHFGTAHFERESVEAATRELSRSLGVVREIHLDEIQFDGGLLYEVATGVVFAEMTLSLSLSLTNIFQKDQSLYGLGPSFSLPGLLSPFFLNQTPPLQAVPPSTFGVQSPLQAVLPSSFGVQSPAGQVTTRHLRARAHAQFSARIQEDTVKEVSLEGLKIDTVNDVSSSTRSK